VRFATSSSAPTARLNRWIRLVAQQSIEAEFVHHVQAAGPSSVRQFNELEVGDLIPDFRGDAVADGLRDLVFVVNGKAYVAKQASKKLA
jgi:hypothetical protein